MINSSFYFIYLRKILFHNVCIQKQQLLFVIRIYQLILFNQFESQMQDSEINKGGLTVENEPQPTDDQIMHDTSPLKVDDAMNDQKNQIHVDIKFSNHKYSSEGADETPQVRDATAISKEELGSSTSGPVGQEIFKKRAVKLKHLEDNDYTLPENDYQAGNHPTFSKSNNSPLKVNSYCKKTFEQTSMQYPTDTPSIEFKDFEQNAHRNPPYLSSLENSQSGELQSHHKTGDGREVNGETLPSPKVSPDLIALGSQIGRLPPPPLGYAYGLIQNHPQTANIQQRPKKLVKPKNKDHSRKGNKSTGRGKSLGPLKQEYQLKYSSQVEPQRRPGYIQFGPIPASAPSPRSLEDNNMVRNAQSIDPSRALDGIQISKENSIVFYNKKAIESGSFRPQNYIQSLPVEDKRSSPFEKYATGTKIQGKVKLSNQFIAATAYKAKPSQTMLYDKVPIKLNQSGLTPGVDYHYQRILLNSSAVTQDHEGLEHGEFKQVDFSGEGSTRFMHGATRGDSSLRQSKNSTSGPNDSRALPEIFSRMNNQTVLSNQPPLDSINVPFYQQSHNLYVNRQNIQTVGGQRNKSNHRAKLRMNRDSVHQPSQSSRTPANIQARTIRQRLNQEQAKLNKKEDEASPRMDFQQAAKIIAKKKLSVQTKRRMPGSVQSPRGVLAQTQFPGGSSTRNNDTDSYNGTQSFEAYFKTKQQMPKGFMPIGRSTKRQSMPHQDTSLLEHLLKLDEAKSKADKVQSQKQVENDEISGKKATNPSEVEIIDDSSALVNVPISYSIKEDENLLAAQRVIKKRPKNKGEKFSGPSKSPKNLSGNFQKKNIESFLRGQSQKKQRTPRVGQKQSPRQIDASSAIQRESLLSDEFNTLPENKKAEIMGYGYQPKNKSFERAEKERLKELQTMIGDLQIQEMRIKENLKNPKRIQIPEPKPPLKIPVNHQQIADLLPAYEQANLHYHLDKKLDELRYNRLKSKIEKNLVEENEKDELKLKKKSITENKKNFKFQASSKQKANLINTLEKQQTEDSKPRSRTVKFTKEQNKSKGPRPEKSKPLTDRSGKGKETVESKLKEIEALKKKNAEIMNMSLGTASIFKKSKRSLGAELTPGRLRDSQISHLKSKPFQSAYKNTSLELLSTGGMSEIFRQSHRMTTRNKEDKLLNLDARNMAKLMDPENILDMSLYIPEGYRDPKIQLDNLDHFLPLNSVKNRGSKTDRSAIKSIGSYKESNRGSQENDQNQADEQQINKINRIKNEVSMKKALDYQFTVNDITKYSKWLRPNDCNFKFDRSALGKIVPEVSARKLRLQNANYFDKLLKILKHTDWQRTPVYHQYVRNQRWIHEDDSIYSDQEMKYIESKIKAELSQENKNEYKEDEGITILAQHLDKTMHTLESLMNQLNMMYYWEKVRLYFKVNAPSIEQLLKLMNRILKLYLMIDNFMKIYKMIDKKERNEMRQRQKNNGRVVFDQNINKRIQVSIKGLLKENPMLPTSFIYGGECYLEKLKREQVEESVHIQTSPQQYLDDKNDWEEEQNLAQKAAGKKKVKVEEAPVIEIKPVLQEVKKEVKKQYIQRREYFDLIRRKSPQVQQIQQDYNEEEETQTFSQIEQSVKKDDNIVDDEFKAKKNKQDLQQEEDPSSSKANFSEFEVPQQKLQQQQKESHEIINSKQEEIKVNSQNNSHLNTKQIYQLSDPTMRAAIQDGYYQEETEKILQQKPSQTQNIIKQEPQQIAVQQSTPEVKKIIEQQPTPETLKVQKSEQVSTPEHKQIVKQDSAPESFVKIQEQQPNQDAQENFISKPASKPQIPTLPLNQVLQTPVKYVDDSKENSPIKSSYTSSPGRIRTISQHLQSYSNNFSIDIDEQWDNCAQKDPQLLTKEEAKVFMTNISMHVSKERGKFYNNGNFDMLFEEMDQDLKGHLSKNEVAMLIKRAFKDPRIQLTPIRQTDK